MSRENALQEGTQITSIFLGMGTSILYALFRDRKALSISLWQRKKRGVDKVGIGPRGPALLPWAPGGPDCEAPDPGVFNNLKGVEGVFFTPAPNPAVRAFRAIFLEE